MSCSAMLSQTPESKGRYLINEVSTSELKRSVETQYGGIATLAQSVPSKRRTCSSPIKGSDKRRFFAVLHQGRLNRRWMRYERRSWRSREQIDKFGDIAMAIWVVRNTDQTGESPYGRTITESASLKLEYGNMVRIGFATKRSQFSVLIKPDSFAEVVAMMMKADPNEAIKAFGSAMLGGIENPKNSN
jgi:hypothetical protein